MDRRTAETDSNEQQNQIVTVKEDSTPTDRQPDNECRLEIRKGRRVAELAFVETAQ